MKYKFVRERDNYEDYASGRVLYGIPGHPALPVRLTSEVFLRCLAVRKANGSTCPCVLYDPCCGGAYHLSVLGFLHGDHIQTIVGSDIDPDALRLAQRNLDLLTPDGLERRTAEIAEMCSLYGKSSHTEALVSARRLQARLELQRRIETRLFRSDATSKDALARHLGHTRVDIVLTDVPYGVRSEWQGEDDVSVKTSAMWHMLDALQTVLTYQSVVAVVADKGQKIAHQSYHRVQRFRVGKRQIAILTVVQARTPIPGTE